MQATRKGMPASDTRSWQGPVGARKPTDSRLQQGALCSPKERFDPVWDISVVIPALNEETHIPSAIRFLEGEPGIGQVIVADGGSTDRTRLLAARLGARVIRAPCGRGFQIRQGIASARGSVILVLHADCRLHPGTGSRLLAALNRDPAAAGGAMGMRFDMPGAGLRLIACLNNVRARLTGIAFGDQGQFFRREALLLIGGFPGQMLLEDVELSLRLRQAGRVLYLAGGITASGRRWRRHSTPRNAVTVLWLLTRYLVHRTSGRDVVSEAARAYRRYYDH